jgi:hypothetical protein
VQVDELAPGLWRWTAEHPEWTPEAGAEGWDAEVASVYWEGDDAVCLVDPLVPVEPVERDRFWHHLDEDVTRAARPLAVIVTISFHARSARDVADRYGGAVWAFERDVPSSPIDADRRYAAGDRLPGGFDARETARPEGLLWLPAHGALVAGDVLLGGPLRVCPWFRSDEGRAATVEALRPLLDLPVERVLTSHGEPVLSDGRAALARALDDATP